MPLFFRFADLFAKLYIHKSSLRVPVVREIEPVMFLLETSYHIPRDVTRILVDTYRITECCAAGRDWLARREWQAPWGVGCIL
jgi:hypothetical protein